MSAFFYIFSMATLVSGFMVVTARNPVHAILFLIVAFLNSAGLFVLLGAEFLAMVLVIVYVGAVAVLFLFVVMMLDVGIVELKQGFWRHFPLGASVAGVLLLELLLVLSAWVPSRYALQVVRSPVDGAVSNTRALGQIIYTENVHYFQLAGLVLLVAMIGAIVLTLHHRSNVRRQSVAEQVARCPESSVELRKVRSGEGV